MFQFVNSTAGELRQNDDLKRLVRSHAMKDFRARQRKARSSLEGTEPDTSSRPSRLILALRSTEQTEDCRQSQPENFEDYPATTNGHTSSLRTVNPSTWGGTAGEIFQSPRQLQQMLGLCHEWFRWLRPDMQSDPNDRSVSVNTNLTSCPTLLCAISISAIAGLDAADRRLPSGLEVLFKNKVIQEVQVQIQSCSPTTMDQIMSALVFLIAHDFYRVDSSAVTHLRGLRSILCLNGQRNPGAKWGGGLVIESMDLFIALWLDTETLIVTDDHDTTGAAQCYRPDRPSHEVKDEFEEIARLVVYEQMAAVDKAVGNVARTRERSESLIELFTAFNSCVDSYGKGCRELYHYLSDKMFEQLARFSERFCESTPEEETEGHHLARIGHQTLAILYNVMVNQHPFSHPKNQGYVNGIAEAVSALDKIWRPYPYLRFLALLTGACAAKDQRTKAFFHTRLARALRALEYTAWPDVKYFVIHFRQFRSIIEPRPAKPGRRCKSSLEVSSFGINKERASPRKESLPAVDKLLGIGNLVWNGLSYGHGPQEVLYDSSTFQQAVLHGLYWRTEAQVTGVC